MVAAGVVPGAMTVERRRELLRAKGRIEYMPPDGGPHSWNDLGNAERFLSSFGDELGFCVESGKWMVYTGRHWQVDNIYYISEYARVFVKEELVEAIRSGQKFRIKNAERLNNEAGFTAMFKMATRLRAVSISEFDGPATYYKINCRNGTLDLKTGALDPHRAEDRITRFIDVDYEPDIESPAFERFLRVIQPDASIRAFLQRSIGYSMLGVVRERSFWILYGGGNNGKSVFTNLFTTMLGDYACGTTSETIMDAKRQGGSANSDIARLRGKRYVVIPETAENERLNASLIKALSAGDVITARHLYGEYFDFPFTGKMWIATNHKPTITDHSKGFWDRLKLVPFTVSVPDDQVIKSDILLAQLMNERSGILTWAVQGARDYFDMDGLAVPDVIQAEIDQYKFEQDSIAQFIGDACYTFKASLANAELNPRVDVGLESDYQVKNSEIYKAYGEYCRNNGDRPWPQRRFTSALRERGFHQRNSGGRYWEGLRLKED